MAKQTDYYTRCALEIAQEEARDYVRQAIAENGPLFSYESSEADVESCNKAILENLKSTKGEVKNVSSK